MTDPHNHLDDLLMGRGPGAGWRDPAHGCTHDWPAWEAHSQGGRTLEFRECRKCRAREVREPGEAQP